MADLPSLEVFKRALDLALGVLLDKQEDLLKERQSNTFLSIHFHALGLLKSHVVCCGFGLV